MVWCGGNLPIVIPLQVENFALLCPGLWQLVIGLQVSVGSKPYGKMLLMLGNFELRFLKFQQIGL